MIRSIRTKIIGISLGIVFAALTLNTLASSVIFRRDYSRALQAKVLVTGYTLKLQLERLLALGLDLEDLVGFDEQCREKVERHEVSYALVVDRAGRILFSHDGRGWNGSVRIKSLILAARQAWESTGLVQWRGTSYYNVTVPVYGERGQHLGAVMVGFPRADITQKVGVLARHSFFLGLVFFIAAAVLMLLALSVWVSRPLRRLFTVIGQIRKSGAATAEETRIHTHDEVGQLAVAFDQLVADLRASQEEVRSHTAMLERNVAERTQELRQVNEELQSDIRRRKETERQLALSVAKLHSAIEGAIRAMARSVELHDPYTAGHQRRVAKLAAAIACAMSLPDYQVDGINLAAGVHDVGKISVPGEILSKPGRLSQVEFNLVKTHSEIGYDILKSIEFPWPIARIVLEHHMRIDGSGYPANPDGNELLLEARIIAVADVVEAMSSHRPHRPALGTEKALEEIANNSGTYYDPEVVRICLKLFADGFAFD